MSWYIGMGHDPEVPAGFQDADIEMAEMREAADEQERRTRYETREAARKLEPVPCWVYPCSNCGDVTRVEPSILTEQYLRTSGQIMCDCGWALSSGYVEREVVAGPDASDGPATTKEEM